ncbi:interferon beta [Acomys russatus]|uniref:interferon beta n=1 Tax=Acomys russatus TaxID=60746 RepID=UPI0021E1CC1C|nr:interferon beta [Acomys russatus]
MTHRWVLHAAFLLCFSTTALSIDYRQLLLQQSNSTRACLDLLRQLDRTLCFSDRVDFKIPEAVKHPRQMGKSYTAFVIQRMLQNIFLLFKNNSSSTGWNATIIERLLDKLHKQIEFLETILKDKQEKEWGTSPAILHLKGYYWRVQRYLKKKGYSSCAWIAAREEISRNFAIIQRLTKNFQD